MPTWPGYPVICEINTRVWPNDLSRTPQRRVDLATVPDAEGDAIAARGFDAAWFMGARERSPAGIADSIWASDPSRRPDDIKVVIQFAEA